MLIPKVLPTLIFVPKTKGFWRSMAVFKVMFPLTGLSWRPTAGAGLRFASLAVVVVVGAVVVVVVVAIIDIANAVDVVCCCWS